MLYLENDVFLIDGHNLLWAVLGLGDGESEISDVGLCWVVGRYLRRVGEKGEIVFDGIGPRDKSDFDGVDGVEIVFAGLGTDADTVVERKITANTAPRRLKVVSSDNRLRKAARARRAVAIKSDDFWSDVQRELGRKRAAGQREPMSKQGGLSAAETEQWLEFFGIED